MCAWPQLYVLVEWTNQGSDILHKHLIATQAHVAAVQPTSKVKLEL